MTEEMTMIDKCFECKYNRRGFTAHRSCHHPDIEHVHKDEGMGLMAAVAGVFGTTTISASYSKLNLKVTPHGLRMGWFNWPWDFDPTWLEHCDGYKPKEKD